jgi:hypothetical protein
MSLVLIFIECLVTAVLIIEVGTAARVSRGASDSKDVYFVYIHKIGQP